MKVHDNSQLITGIFGSPDFCRRLHAVIRPLDGIASVVTSSLADAWGTVLTHRPNLVIVEVGFHHGDRSQVVIRSLLEQLRDRSGQDVFIAAALTAAETLAYGGDLLYANPRDLEPSAYIDTYLALPPSHLPSLPGLTEQVLNVVKLVEYDHVRRTEGGDPLPPLGATGWVQSLADPLSRELWMKWLPRYASYTNENPIILGDTGTGKTNLARALHNLSGRTGSFVSITPRDFSSSELVQVELFGAVAGAYTGAVDKWGLVKSAEGGTLFIDELQSIDKDLQGKLITFIENKVYRRVGSAESIEADVRFVFASNRNLYEMMQTGTLRDDFAYRLERVQLDLRPLESRRLDIASALGYALAKVQRQRPLRNQIHGVSSNAYRRLLGSSWPGNLRQLENTVAQLCERADMEQQTVIGDKIVRQVLENSISSTISNSPEVLLEAAYRLAKSEDITALQSLKGGIQKFTEMVRVTALEVTGGNVSEASQLLEDDPRLLDLIARSLLAKQETDPRIDKR